MSTVAAQRDSSWTVGGVVLGRYRLLSRLPGDDAAEVFHALDLMEGAECQAKRLTLPREQLDQLAADLSGLSTLQHPGLLRMERVEAWGAEAVLFMEHVEGEVLEDLWQARGRRLPPELVATLGVQLLESLAAMHDRGVHHMALKPRNLIVTHAGRLKVAGHCITPSLRKQFCLAICHDDAGVYEPPERAPSEGPLPADAPAADLYAVGLILHRLLAGGLPYEERSTPARAWHGRRGRRLPPTGTWLDGWLWLATDFIPAMRPTPRALAAGLRAGKALDEARLAVSGRGVAQAPVYPSEVVDPLDAGFAPRGGAPVLIRVRPGTFVQGADPSDPEVFEDERPPHQVTLTRPFAIGSVPVTQEQYTALGFDNPSRFKAPQRPVERVTWFEAVAWCNALSRRTGLPEAYLIDGEQVTWLGLDNGGWRLPTEAEWEYACRAGCALPRYGPLDEVAWYDGNSGKQSHDVGLKAPNAWGLYDMLGNVMEWCWDWLESYRPSLQIDPTGPQTGSARVRRGGSWGFGGQFVRASYRYYFGPGSRNFLLGFRVVRTLVDGRD